MISHLLHLQAIAKDALIVILILYPLRLLYVLAGMMDQTNTEWRRRHGEDDE